MNEGNIVCPIFEVVGNEILEAVYRFTNRNWQKIEFAEISDHPTDRRPPMLLVHGQPGCGSRWGFLPSSLDQRFEMYSYDRPGWGMSTTKAQDITSNAHLLNSVASQIHRATGQEPIIMAYSYGAAIALMSLSTSKSAFSTALLIAPAISPQAINRYDKLFGYRIFGPVAAFVTSLFSSKYIGSGFREVLRSSRSLRVEAKNLLSELADMPNQDLSKKKIAILAGTADFVTPPESIYDGAKKFSLSSIEWVNGGSHLLPWKNSDAILSFTERAIIRTE